MVDATTNAIAIACGAGGTYVDVSLDISQAEGAITYFEGKRSPTDSLTPSVLSFTLNNYDATTGVLGTYTPDNPLSTLALPLVEGMGVCWSLNGRLIAGAIRSLQLIIPTGGTKDSARIRVTADDMLGAAARHTLTDLPAALRTISAAYYWPLNEVAGTSAAAESHGYAPYIVVDTSSAAASSFQLGPASTDIPGATNVAAVTSTGAGSAVVGAYNNLPSLVYPSTSMGFTSIWVEEGALTPWYYRILTGLPFPNRTFSISNGAAGTGLRVTAPEGIVFVDSPVLTPGVAYNVGVNVTTNFVAGAWQFVMELFVNNVSRGTATYIPTTPITSLSQSQRQTIGVDFQAFSGLAGTVYFARSIHSIAQFDDYSPYSATAQARLPIIAATTPEITLDTVPTMSPAVLGAQGGSTTLAAFDEVLRGEQGYIYPTTTGTLTAPVQKLTTVARNRKRAVDYTFDLSEIHDQPTFVRALTNSIQQATANGPTTSATYADSTLTALVGTSSASDEVTLRDYSDLYASASDRVYRGKNTGLPVVSFKIDARALNRWADLLAIRQGFRVQITGFNAALFGFTTADVWIIGRSENHTPETRNWFEFFCTPAWTPPVYGTARYAGGTGAHTLQANITSGAASMGIVSTGVLWTIDPAAFPMNVRIGKEVMTLSAVSGAASPQTATISARGVGISPAAAHTAADGVDIDTGVLPVLPRYDY